MPDGSSLAPRDGYYHYPQLPAPRPVMRRTIFQPDAILNNQRVLADQVRTSGGASNAGGLVGEDGRVVWGRMARLLPPRWARAPIMDALPPPEPEPEATPSARQVTMAQNHAMLLRLMERLAREDGVLPYLPELAALAGYSSSKMLLAALRRLEANEILRLEVRPRGTRPADLRVTLPHIGAVTTAGWGKPA